MTAKVDKQTLNAAKILKRLRESSKLTTRQAAALVGVTHTTISHFENEKRVFSNFRIEQLVRAYGYTMEEFHKILGCKPLISLKEDCAAMIDLLDDEQLSALRQLLMQFVRISQPQLATISKDYNDKATP